MKTSTVFSAIASLFILALILISQPVFAQKNGKATAAKPAAAPVAKTPATKPLAAKRPAASQTPPAEAVKSTKADSAQTAAKKTKTDAAKDRKKTDAPKASQSSKEKASKPERPKKQRGVVYTLGVEMAKSLKAVGMQELERAGQDPVRTAEEVKQHVEERYKDIKSGRIIKIIPKELKKVGQSLGLQ